MPKVLNHSPEHSAMLENYRGVANRDLLPKTFVEYMTGLDIQPVTVYDIGSSMLHWYKHAQRIWPESSVYAFEANVDAQVIYQEHSVSNYHLGVLTDCDHRTVTFWNNPENTTGNSYYRENTPAYEHSNSQIRSGLTLDTVVSQRCWPLPDLMKIDVQGSELDVLRGATKCLSQCRDLFVECQLAEYNLGAPDAQQVIDYLSQLGFGLVGEIDRTHVDIDYHFSRDSTS